MSRYCQLKLIDALKPEMSKNKSKRTVVKTFPSESKSTKTRLGNLSLLKIKNDISCDVTNDLTETRETRLTKKLNTPKKSNVLQDVYVDSGGLRKLSESKPETTAGKRKRYDKVKNIEEPSSKKICSSESTHIQSSNNPDKRISQSRKRKRKPRESCWENKLTGARRVSKRLSNIRMERKKSLRSLGSTEEVSFESRQPINFSARGKIKPIKEDRNPTKRRKPYYRNHPEVQFNFGKLSHTKRFYPKVAPGRRPATYTVTIKPTGFIQQSPRKRNKGNYEHITYNRFDEDINDSDINSLINKYVEDIQDEIVNEAGTKELSDSDITEDKETDKSNDQSTSKETTEESIVEAVPQESEVQTLVCGTVEEEFIDGSTIVIVDIESGENVECGTSEENVECGTSEENVECGTSEENTRDKQSSVSERNYEVTKLSEEKSDLGEPSGDVTLIDLKHDQSEEKSNDIESNGLNTNRSEADIKPETTNYESAPTTVESSVSSPVTETIDITNTAD